MEVDILHGLVQMKQLKNNTFDEGENKRKPTSAFLLITVSLFGKMIIT